MAKPKTEWRLVCGNHGKTGHSSHSWVKKDRSKAFKDKQDADLHGEHHPNSYYRKETPYRVQRREVTPWEDATL